MRQVPGLSAMSPCEACCRQAMLMISLQPASWLASWQAAESVPVVQSVLAVTLLAQAAFDALAAASADSMLSPAPAQTAQARHAPYAVLPSQHAAGGSSPAEKADSKLPATGSPAQPASASQAQTGVVIKLAGMDVPLPGTAQPDERSAQTHGAAGVSLIQASTKTEAAEGGRDMTADRSAGVNEGRLGESGFGLEPDDLLGSGGVATWLADSKQQLRAAEQARPCLVHLPASSF